MKRLLVLGTLGLLSTVGTCLAQVNPSPVSDSLTVFDPNHNILFQGGVREDGTIFGLGCIGQFCGVSEDPTNIYYIPGLNIPGVGLVPSGNAGQAQNPLGILEAPGSTLSDIVLVQLVSDFDQLAFRSDSEALFLNPGITNLIPEGNGFIDVTPYLNPGLSGAGFTAQFFSDPEAPEPATFGMIGAGLLAVFATLRKRAARQA